MFAAFLPFLGYLLFLQVIYIPMYCNLDQTITLTVENIWKARFRDATICLAAGSQLLTKSVILINITIILLSITSKGFKFSWSIRSVLGNLTLRDN